VVATLAELGIAVEPDEVRLERRDERWLVRLPGDRIAWLAASPAGRERLHVERRVLRLLRARCTFRTPRILAERPDGSFDVRETVPGLVDPWGVFATVTHDGALAARIGAEIGAILVEQHTRITAADAGDWLAREPGWPRPSAWVRGRLPHVLDDARLAAAVDGVLVRYDAVPVADADRVLVHGDLGLHNLAFDPTTLAVRGVFDYDGASWSDRHHDFRYLVFDVDRPEMLEAALAVYEPAVGARIDRARVALYNAACAVSFLADRAGTPPDERPCGRTLAEDLRWVEQATARALGRADPHG
jgi:aminoglycoside phosphotransferase (APT) family kinase protein